MRPEHGHIEVGVELVGVDAERVPRARQHGQHGAHAQQALARAHQLVGDQLRQDRHQVRVELQVDHVGEPVPKQMYSIKLFCVLKSFDNMYKIKHLFIYMLCLKINILISVV